MSDKLLDKLDEKLDSDDEDAQDVNDALSDDEQYWSSRNKVQKAKDAIESDDDNQ